MGVKHGSPRAAPERSDGGNPEAVAVSGAERSSLVLGKNNSTKPETAETEQYEQTTLQGEGQFSDDGDERYDCRHVYRNFEHESEDGETAPFRCNQWVCYCCGYRMRQNLVEEIARVCKERPALRRLMTLTLDPSKAPADQDEQHRYLTERLNALRTALDRKFDGKISYIWVREEGEKSDDLHPHLHILVNQYIDQGWLSSTWSALGGGEVVDIRYIDRVEKAAHYIGKYLTKNALSGLPKGIRRYGSSQDIDLDVRGGSGESEKDWTLLMDDFEISTDDGEPLRRGVTKTDIYLQKEHGGPVGLPPP